MIGLISSWLAPASPNPAVARQEYVLNWVLAGLTGTGFLYGLAVLIAATLGDVPLLGALAAFGALPIYAWAYGLGRRGHVRQAALVPVIFLFLLMLLVQYYLGFGHSSMVGLAMAIVVAGTLLEIWAAIATALLSTIAYLLLGLMQLAGHLPSPLQPADTLVADAVAMGFGLVAVAMLVWLSQHQASRALAQAQESERRAQVYARELETVQGRLERQVEDRTQELTEFARQLGYSLEEQQRLWETVQRLSIPIVPVHEGIIVVPLIGQIDPSRANRMVDEMLGAIEDQAASVVIVDITGVPAMDVQLAASLIQAADAARLLGAEMVLVGIRPDVADAIVRLSLSLEGITTQRDLQAGVGYALSRRVDSVESARTEGHQQPSSRQLAERSTQ